MAAPSFSVNRGIREIVSGSCKQFLVIQEAFGNRVATVRDHDNAFESDVFAELFIDGVKHVVDKEKAVPGVFGDGGDFVGMKTQVQRMQDTAGRGNSEEGFQMARMIPHHGSDAVPWFEPEFPEGRGKAASATIEVPVTAANDRVVRLPRNDFNAGKDFPGALQDGRERQWEIHHRAAHGSSDNSGAC